MDQRRCGDRKVAMTKRLVRVFGDESKLSRRSWFLSATLHLALIELESRRNGSPSNRDELDVLCDVTRPESEGS